MTPRTIIFDLDGTLIHSAPDLHAATNVTLRRLGRTQLDLATVISFIGNGVETLVRRALTATGACDDALHRDALALFLKAYEADMTTLTRPYPGVVETLQTLRDAGHPLGICTNKPTGPARDICAALDLTRYFDVISGAEAGQPKKPDAAPLLQVAHALGGTDPVYVGDSAVDYHTALNAHLPFRLFSGGYLNDPLPDLAPADRFDNWTADAILKV